ncbi:FAD-binding oxidoreductase [Oscillochloris sp. ZM17-4]|uniref:NAD(P)/FAD-dependent oxidoreductase n=1 Tax=Oscillochloris sp. ZM17-4 TaxID=2866714 RepID=UPI001C731B3D|nr:FAD-dependent oxidoreductase [Oscillochloris sp. ZM17-4]MBX0328171.1 FAD-binding oxidoreductase [Oscillochloris sp. ZM17-4]
MISYWHASIGHAPLADDGLPAEARVAVVGGGVHGASAALWLARAGLAPLLIERAGPAAGASGHNGGLLVSGLAEGYPAAVARFGREAARAIYALTLEGYGLMGDIVREESIDCDLRLTGNLSLALGEEGLDAARQTAALLREDGLPAELLDRRAVEGLVGAPLGAEILALNAWSGDLLPDLAGMITPVRGQALSTGPLPPMLPGGFGVSLTPTGEYGQQALDGRVIFGGFRAVAPGRDVGVREPGGSPEVQAALDEGLARIFPSLAGAPVELRWSSTMGFSPDYLPIADAVPGLPGAWFSGGFSGHGMPYAAILSRLLAEAAASGAAPAALAPFRLSRL